jgi:hypothetical protein
MGPVHGLIVCLYLGPFAGIMTRFQQLRPQVSQDVLSGKGTGLRVVESICHKHLHLLLYYGQISNKTICMKCFVT